MVISYPAILKKKDTLFIFLLAITAPLFNLKIVASVTVFDLITFFALLVFFTYSLRKWTILSLSLFFLIYLFSEWHGLISVVNDGSKLADSINILFRYSILLFVMPYLSYRLFYKVSDSERNIALFYDLLMLSFFGVLLLNMYAIYFGIEEYFFLQRFCSIYGNANTAALVFNIMSVLYLLNTSHNKTFMRVISYTAIPLIIISLVLTGSFSGYLVQSLILLYFFIRAANLKIFLFISVASTILFLSLDYIYVDEYSPIMRGLGRFIDLVEILSTSGFKITELGSAGERLLSIQMSIFEIFNNPLYLITGIGFGNVETLVQKETGFRTSIHLNYLQLILSIGIIGTLMYVFVFLRALFFIPKLNISKRLRFQSISLVLFFLLLGMFIPHTYMSFYYAPILPLLGSYLAIEEYA